MNRDRGPAVPARAHPKPAAPPPALAPDVRLIGEFPAAGFEETHYLIQRGESFVQVAELLYRVAEEFDGRRSYEEIATHVSDSTQWSITPLVARELVEKKLAPLGIVRMEDTNVERATEGPTALGVNLRLKVLGPRVIGPVTRVLQGLFMPALLIPVVAAIVAFHAWLYFERGIATAFAEVLTQPGLLLVLIALVLAAAVVHEFGHASALRYSGGRVRSMGVGFFTIYPVFYTDATDGYRLSRAGRVRTDLGGVYFHLLFTLGLFGAFGATGRDFWLLGVVLIDIEAIRQFIPFVRLDGYWLITDLTGIPDLMSHVRPFLKSLLARRPRLPAFKRWVQVVFIVYVVVGIPFLTGLTVLFAVRLPQFVAGLWEAGSAQLRLVRVATERSDPVLFGIGAVQFVIVAAVLAGTAYFVVMVGSRIAIRALGPRFLKPAPSVEGPI